MSQPPSGEYPTPGDDTPYYPPPPPPAADPHSAAHGQGDGYGYAPGTQNEAYGHGYGPDQPGGYGYAPGAQGEAYGYGAEYGASGRQSGAYVPEPLTGAGGAGADGEWAGEQAAPRAAQAWDPAPATDDPHAYGTPTYGTGPANPYGNAPAAGDPYAAAEPQAYGTAPAADPYGTASPNAYGTAPAPGDPQAYGAAPAAGGPHSYGAGPAAGDPRAYRAAAPRPHRPQDPYGTGTAHGTGDPNVYGAVQHPYAPAGYAEYQGSPAQAVGQTAVLPVIEDGPGPDEATAPPARTGSPIIAPGIQPAALTAVLGGLLAAGAAIGKPGLAVVLVLLQAVTAAGWFRLNGMWPARQGIALAFLGGVVADAAVLAVTGAHGPAALVGTLGVWLLLVLVLQLRHHGSPDERLSSLTATSASTLLTVLAAGYLATATAHTGTDPVVVGTIAVAVATLVRALPLPGAAVSIAGSLLLAAASGYAGGHAAGYPAGHAVLLAAAAGACALIGLRVASYDFPSRFVHFTAGVALPLTAAAPVVYVLSRALA